MRAKKIFVLCLATILMANFSLPTESFAQSKQKLSKAERIKRLKKLKRMREAKKRNKKSDEMEVDVSGLKEEYWRPQKDELEVIQEKKYKKDGRFETSLLYAFNQDNELLDTKAYGLALAYHITDRIGVEAMYLKMSNEKSDLTKAFEAQFSASPNFNNEKSLSTLSVVWTPIYAKFSFLGKKISHLETYIAPGAGITRVEENNDNHFTASLAIGEKFFITKNLLLRIEWKIAQYKDKVEATTGSASLANGGSGFVEPTLTRHNLIFGLGWLF